MIKTAYIVSFGKGLESFIYREAEEMMKRGVNITFFVTKYRKNDVFSPKREWRVELFSYPKIIISLLIHFFSQPIKTAILLKLSIKSNTIVELFMAFDYSI